MFAAAPACKCHSKQTHLLTGITVAELAKMSLGSSLELSFAAPEPGGMLTVSTGDRADAALRAYGGDVAYRVGDGRIAVDNRRPAGRYTLEVPVTLGHLEVLVGARRVFDSAERPLGANPDSVSLSP